MIFSSIIFLFAFLPCCLFGYYVIFKNKRKGQNFFLLLCSVLFYAWGGVSYTLLIIFSIIANWLFALQINRKKRMDDRSSGPKLFLVLSVVFNVLILFVFKYLNFTVNNINSLFGASLTIPTIAMPIGISFFTFQGMSYVIDVYRGHGDALKNPLDVGLYISFFPQLIAGPIVRYETVADQIYNRQESVDLFYDGMVRFVIGLSKKVLLANSLGVISNQVFTQYCTSVLGAWIGAIAYTLQIYFDFSGYSDMAIGLGKIFGFTFDENFDHPYLSTSITVFWRKWHISMGTWFRDYVYFPLGGSRVSKSRAVINLTIVWLLTGIWHGANWTFILWGMMQLLVIIIERVTGIHKSDKRIVKIFGWMYSMLFVIIGWVLFNSASVSDAFRFYGVMFGLKGVPILDDYAVYTLSHNIVLFIVSAVCCLPIGAFIKKHIRRRNKVTSICFTLLIFALLIISVAYTAKSAYSPFIYFNF